MKRLLPGLGLTLLCASCEYDASRLNLYGGESATIDGLPGFVYVGDDCGGAKVGPYHYLTAAHCISEIMPTEGLAPKLQPGSYVMLNQDPTNRKEHRQKAYVHNVAIHPTMAKVTTDPRTFNVMGLDKAFDVAIITVEQENEIPIAPISFEPPSPGDFITLTGGGCEYFQREAVTESIKNTGPLKAATKAVSWIDRTALALLPDPMNDEDSEARLCAGDSGSPAYIDIDGVRHVVGVNSGFSNSDNASRIARLDRTAMAMTETGEAQTVADWMKLALETRPNPETMVSKMPWQPISCRFATDDGSFTFQLNNGIRRRDQMILDVQNPLVLVGTVEGETVQLELEESIATNVLLTTAKHVTADGMLHMFNFHLYTWGKEDEIRLSHLTCRPDEIKDSCWEVKERPDHEVAISLSGCFPVG